MTHDDLRLFNMLAAGTDPQRRLIKIRMLIRIAMIGKKTITGSSCHRLTYIFGFKAYMLLVLTPGSTVVRLGEGGGGLGVAVAVVSVVESSSRHRWQGAAAEVF